MKFEYLKNPDLVNVNPNFKGNKYANGRFYNEKIRKQPGFKEVLDWKLEGNPQKSEKRNDEFRVKRIENNDFVNKQEDMVVWLGHACFFIRLNGMNLLFDPCLENLFTLRRLVKMPCDYAHLTPLDGILLSHGHRDHLDFTSLKKIRKYNPDTPFLTPLKISELIIKKIPEAICQEAAWFQQFDLIENIKITFLPAIHWNRRSINDYNWELWGSYMLEANGVKMFFGGDSAYGDHFKQVKEVMGAPDYAILGVGAYKPSIIMRSSHTSPQEAVQAFHDLGAKTFIPMHYGTYDLSDEPISEPLTVLKSMKEKGELKGELAALAVGEELLL